jgi:hypothetical protein
MLDNINEIIEAAINLKITLTNAELGSELCEAWSARVLQAKQHAERGEPVECETMRAEANRYAI